MLNSCAGENEGRHHVHSHRMRCCSRYCLLDRPPVGQGDRAKSVCVRWRYNSADRCFRSPRLEIDRMGASCDPCHARDRCRQDTLTPTSTAGSRPIARKMRRRLMALAGATDKRIRGRTGAIKSQNKRTAPFFIIPLVARGAYATIVEKVENKKTVVTACNLCLARTSEKKLSGRAGDGVRSLRARSSWGGCRSSVSWTGPRVSNGPPRLCSASLVGPRIARSRSSIAARRDAPSASRCDAVSELSRLLPKWDGRCAVQE
jgi:hypothetical protein